MNQRRVAIVTGTNRGIGYEIARQLAVAATTVVATARTTKTARETADRLRLEGADVSPEALDLTDQVSIDRAVAAVISRHGRIDILINNAAIAIDARMLAADPDLDVAHHTLETNLFGTWRMCAAVIPHMRAAGYGRIVNLTTHMAILSDMTSGSPAYRISKTAINALTRILADEVRDTGILVNAASPGRVHTRIGPRTAARTPTEAAASLLWLTALPADGPSGQVFSETDTLPW